MENKHLHLLWTNADPLTSHYMVMLYSRNGLLRGWWDAVTVIIWGATAQYVAEDADIQEKLKLAQDVGVKFTACVACSDTLGVTEKLNALGIETIRWGQPLTELIQSGAPLISI